MVDILPSTSDAAPPESGEPEVIGVDSDAADAVIAALGSGTARQMLAALHEEPTTASALAERTDTSVQNVQYHLEKLAGADLVEVVDTAYSPKGREMKVYAPSSTPLVVYAGAEEETTGLKTALKRLLGAVGGLAVMSLLIERRFGSGLDFGFSSGAPAGGDEMAETTDGSYQTNASDQVATTTRATEEAETTVRTTDAVTTAEEAATPTPGPADGAAETTTQYAAETTDAARTVTEAAASSGGLDPALAPGLVFFLGGVAVLLVGFAVWYARR